MGFFKRMHTIKSGLLSRDLCWNVTALSIFFAALLNGFGAALYSVTDLGVVGGATRSEARSINSSGKVAGYADFSGGWTFAFIYSHSTITDIGTFGQDLSAAYDINDKGDVVGYSFAPSGQGGWLPRAFLYQRGVMTELGTFFGGGSSYASGINNRGEIVGYADLPGVAEFRAFLYKDGMLTDLGGLDGRYSFANSINDLGQAVGSAYTSTPWGGAYHAVLYENGTVRDLGVLGLATSRAYQINNAGLIVGESQYPGGIGDSTHAFVYHADKMVDIGTLGGRSSAAFGVNNRNQVVGQADITNNDATHAFLFSNGSMIDLNGMIDTNSGWLLYAAYDINSAGRIVGYGRNPAGQGHAFMLNPLPSSKSNPP
jgi:probable HAF family extracellular repeat protein